MISIVRYYIKTSIIFLITGLLTGLHMSVSKYMLNKGFGPDLISAHTHLLLVGSVMMMIMGVALWFFPRPPKEDTRYNPKLLLIVYYLMTISTALRFISSFILNYVNIDILRWSVTIMSAIQIIGIILFFYTMWGRIRATGIKV